MTHQDPTIPAAATEGKRHRKSRFRWIVSAVLLASFAFLVYVTTLIVTLPASALRRIAVIPAPITDLYGGLWEGRAVLDGGYSLDWDLRGWPLFAARGVADWTLQGPDTQLTGVATFTPSSMSATDIVGRIGPGLVDLIPGAVRAIGGTGPSRARQPRCVARRACRGESERRGKRVSQRLEICDVHESDHK